MNISLNPADQLCLIMKRIYDRGMTSLTGGNLSIMDTEGVMWITPSGTDKGKLAPDDIVRVYPDGKTEGKYKPSSEYRIHKKIYEIRPEMKAVAHAHSEGLVALSIAYECLNPRILADAFGLCPAPGMAEYATPGSTELVDAVAKVFAAGHDFTLLKNHAAFCASSESLEDAFLRFEMMEYLARIQLASAFLGGAAALDDRGLAEAAGRERSLGSNRVSAANGSIGASAADGNIGASAADGNIGGIGMCGVSGVSEKSCSGEDEAALYEGSGSHADEYALREKLASFSQRSYEKGLFTGACGTLSARLGRDAFLISPAHKDNAAILPEEFVLIRDAVPENGRIPDRDWKLFESIYRHSPLINALMFGIPVYASAYALAREHFPVEVAPEVYGVLRSSNYMSLSDYLDPDILTGKITDICPFAFVSGKGVLAAGPDLTLTFDKMEVAESTALSLFRVAAAGLGLHPLTDRQLRLTDIH